MLRLLLALLIAAPAASATLTVEGTQFVLTTDGGARLTSAQLVGATLAMTDPDGNAVTARIDAVAPSKEAGDVLLHTLSVRGPDGGFTPMCDADAYGRRAAFPIAGAFDDHGHYVRAPGKWFISCTSGAQAKCILWGYSPFHHGSHGEDFGPYYQACQHLVRADYDGRGTAHTRNGTSIDFWDDAGVETVSSAADPAYAFEAGWGPDGAVCVARTRWPDLLPADVLFASAPRLKAARCDEAEARRRGALIFNRSKVAPATTAPHPAG